MAFVSVTALRPIHLRSTSSLLCSSSSSSSSSSLRPHPRRAFRPSRAPAMAASPGDKVPTDVDLMQLVDGKPTPVKSGTVFAAGKKVAFFTLPGALTPTCQDSHVVDWLAALDDLKAKGVDSVACISVNDPFVMKVFQEKTKAAGKIDFYADGGALFTKAIGVETDTGAFGGVRAMRASYLVDDGTFKQVNVEEGKTGYDGPAKPDTVLAKM